MDERINPLESAAIGELTRKLAKDMEIRSAYRDSEGEPMIFGYKLGIKGLVETYQIGIRRIEPEQQDEFIRGYAHAVAMSDLGINALQVARDERWATAVKQQEELAYQYLKGIQTFRNINP